MPGKNAAFRVKTIPANKRDGINSCLVFGPERRIRNIRNKSSVQNLTVIVEMKLTRMRSQPQLINFVFPFVANAKRG